MLVEDDQPLRILTRTFLEQDGYTVLEAMNGAHAGEIAQQYHGPIHLLLTDIVMPGMNGHTLAQTLSPLRPEMKVIYMSGYMGGNISPNELIDAGLHFIQKPLSRDRLASTMREVLESQ